MTRRYTFDASALTLFDQTGNLFNDGPPPPVDGNGDDTAGDEPDRPRRRTIAERFDAFHDANPWVYDALVGLARDLVNRGRRRIGIGMLYEVLRWQYYRATTDEASDFKLSNDYRSRYARLIMDNESDLAGVFELRELTSP